MAILTLLHSGEFLDYKDKKVRVEFYKVTGVRVYPDALLFSSSGGSFQVAIWSTKESVYLTDPQVSWLNYRLVSTQKLPGSSYYKYIYEITCASKSTSGSRHYEWTVAVDDGPGTGIETNKILIDQKGAEENAFSVSPFALTYYGTGSTQSVYFSNRPSLMYESISYGVGGSDWLTISYPTSSTAEITAFPNLESMSRNATVMFYDPSDSESFVTVNITQLKKTLTTSKSNIRYNVGGGTDGFTAYWTYGSEPTASVSYTWGDPGWLTYVGATVSGSSKVFTYRASENDTLIEREADIIVTNGYDQETVHIRQNRQ